MRHRIIAVALGTLWLGACAATSPPSDGVLFRSENFFRVVEDGFVVPPAGAGKLATDSEDATVFFTGRFYAALMEALPGTPIVSPETTRYLINRAGEGAHSRFVALRRQIARGDSLPDAELAAVLEDIRHRYVLVSWMYEDIVEAIQETNYDDYGSVSSSEDVRRFAYEQVKGRVEAVVLDLQENETVWQGSVFYTTARVYEDGALPREVERARAEAAIRLADYFAKL